MLQKNARRYLARQRYLKTIQLVTRLQQIARQKVAKQRLGELRREKAALIIQKYWRRCLVRRWYLNQLRIIMQIQAGKKNKHIKIVHCIANAKTRYNSIQGIDCTKAFLNDTRAQCCYPDPENSPRMVRHIAIKKGEQYLNITIGLLASDTEHSSITSFAYKHASVAEARGSSLLSCERKHGLSVTLKRCLTSWRTV